MNLLNGNNRKIVIAAGEEHAAVQELTGAVRCTFHHFNGLLLLVLVLSFATFI